MSKFLTKFQRLKLWNGYPLLLSAAFGEFTDSIRISITGYDSSRTIVNTVTSDYAAYNQVIDFNVTEIYGSFSGVAYLVAFIEDGLGLPVSDSVTIDIITPCQQPVMLMGRNCLGGVLQWLFETSQEEDFNNQDQTKNKRQVLSVAGVTKNEWDSLQDFITLGEVYRNNIVEFTSETIKTQSRIGQQLYVIDSEGNKIGVVSNTSKNKTQTRLIQHYFEIEIEYPEIFAV